MYDEFQTTLQTAIDKYVPSKTISKRNATPWINRKVKRLHKRKQRAYNQYRLHHTEAAYKRFQTQRHNAFRETRKSYRNYVSTICSDSPKKFWSYIKSLKVDTIGIPTLEKSGIIESDSKRKAEILNEQFRSVFTKENENLPPMQSSIYPVMPDIRISVDGVRKLLLGLDPSKAPGPDGISSRILKITGEVIAPALTIIFQKSLDTGEIPSSWLRANITPLFKKGERTNPANYRPVSLTCITSKILEHILHSRIMAHYDTLSILTDKQHGFRSKRSCESQLILTINDLAQCLNNKSQIDMAIMDFSKAFDSVPHKRLLLKLCNYGIQNKTLSWISNFLRHRTQRVVVSGEHSAWTDVVSGVPQGTVLGPLLFLTYINDLPDNLKSSVRLFADDCVLYKEIKDCKDSEELQNDLDTLVKWERDWQLSFNPSKCHIMRLSHAKSVKHYNYKLGEAILSEVTGHPYLGIHISNDLTWNAHVNHIVSKANRTLGFVKRNLYSCPRHIKESAYKTLVRPLLEYSSAAWDPHTHILIDRIEMVQRRAARFVCNDYTSRTEGCVTNMLNQLKWPSLEIRRKAHRLTVMQQARLGYLSLPIEDLLQPVQRHSRHAHAFSYKLPSTSKNCFKYSFIPHTIVNWNALPQHLIEIENIDRFKESLLLHLFARD